MANRKRGNGQGTLFRRTERGPWYASCHAADGTHKVRSSRTGSKADAERITRQWVERSSLEREGLIAPEGGTELDQHARAPIATQLETFATAKRAEGRTERYVAETVEMITRASEACR